MLYVTTRNNQDAFTVQHALTDNREEHEGLYLPLHFPKFSLEQLVTMAKKSCNQRIADILNLFFSTRLTGWDIDFCIGRYPIRQETLGHRITMAECWHNPEWSYQRLKKNLSELLAAQIDTPGNWTEIAIRIAVLFGILCELENFSSESIDVAMVGGDFTAPISAWYARKMGLPVGNIICCCNENNQVWDLICHGQMKTDSVSLSTIVPEADITLPVNLERLIFDCGGVVETERYLAACRRGDAYIVETEMLRELRQGLYVSVVSSSRIRSTIPNVYKSHNYLLTPSSALAYSGLQDYRVKTGVTRAAVVLCDNNPVWDAKAVAEAMGISLAELKKKL